MKNMVGLYESTEQNFIDIKVDKNEYFKFRANTSRERFIYGKRRL
jgi:hypothetical protein